MATKTKIYASKPKVMHLPAWQCLALEEEAKHNQTSQVQLVREALEILFHEMGVDKDHYLRATNAPERKIRSSNRRSGTKRI